MQTLALWLVVTAGAVGLEPLDNTPIAGQPTTLTLADYGTPEPGLEVTATYRPQAHPSIVSREVVGVTDASGRVGWTPRAAGVVELSWDGGSRNVTVVQASVPVSGVVVAILAGVLLLGGAGWLFLVMLREDVAEQEALARPDT